MRRSSRAELRAFWRTTEGRELRKNIARLKAARAAREAAAKKEAAA